MVKTSAEITSNIDDMKRYLKDIYLLEKEIFCSATAIQAINNKIDSLGIRNSYEQPNGDTGEGAFTKSAGSTIGFAVLYGLLGLVGGFIIGLFVFFPLSPIFAIVGLVIGAVGFIRSNKTNAKIYKSEMRTYERKVEEDEKRVQSELALVPKYQETANIYSQNISACQNTLNQLYDLDIIFPKYRNFIAISQIYEYYMSGRCTELEGPDGAYNLYENEIRQNIIIIQLNAILANLEGIQQTQYMLYTALCETNRRLEHIESNTEAIAYNTAVTAENSEIVARYYK